MLPEFYEERSAGSDELRWRRGADGILEDIGRSGKIDVAVITVPSDEKPPGSLNIDGRRLVFTGLAIFVAFLLLRVFQRCRLCCRLLVLS